MSNTRSIILVACLVTACNDNTVTVTNKRPEAGINTYEDGDVVPSGSTGFTGWVEDHETSNEALLVTWKLADEVVCEQAAPDASGTTSCEIFLPEGSQTVVLSVEDEGKLKGEATVQLDVQPYGDPWATIVEPSVGGTYYSDQLIEFRGEVGDDEDQPDELDAWWESNLDGTLEVDAAPDGGGEILDFGYLSQGEHAITLHVRNTGLNSATDSVIIEVGGPNSPPSCSIEVPEDGYSVQTGEAIAFEALVADPDVPSDWLTVSWASDWDGALAASTPTSDGQVSLTVSSLSINTHSITMTVTDEVGGTCTDNVRVTVEDCADSWYRDLDGDGYGDAAVVTTGCSAPTGYVGDSSDCDDSSAGVHPGASEVCNGLDDDCDGDIDDEDSSLDTDTTTTWYTDADADGYGDATSTQRACDQPSSTVADASDCDDADANINPGASEACNGYDDDCDGLVDDDDTAVTGTSTFYQDADSDGYGDGGASTAACDQPLGYVADATDCDDGDTATYPGADEYCDATDTDCDGTLDEDDALDAPTWYADSDADSFGDTSRPHSSCSRPSGYASSSGDCDDLDDEVYPGADEHCDGVDNDCDGIVDEDAPADAPDWYADSDGDGYGDAGSSVASCAEPTGYVEDDSDCDDTDASTHPGADEYCDGDDDDCDGTVDEDDAVDALEWYRDADSDGYGTSSSTAWACSEPSGYSDDDGDCNDANAFVNPGEAESCNGVDDDCDGSTDEGVKSTYYRDSDGDGYGTAGTTTTSCSCPSGYSVYGTDCHDSDASVHPGATESCNGEDDDCDGYGDEGLTCTYTLAGDSGLSAGLCVDDDYIIYVNGVYLDSDPIWGLLDCSIPAETIVASPGDTITIEFYDTGGKSHWYNAVYLGLAGTSVYQQVLSAMPTVTDDCSAGASCATAPYDTQDIVIPGIF